MNTSSPLSHKTQKFSYISRLSESISKKSSYKSPNSSPASSPVPFYHNSPKTVHLNHCYSDKQIKKTDEMISKLNEKLILREKRIKILEDENKKLLMNKPANIWEKELKKRNDDIRVLENKLNFYMNLTKGSDNYEELKKTVNQQRKTIEELEKIIKNTNRKNNIEYDAIINDLKTENIKLIEKLTLHKSCLSKNELDEIYEKIKFLENNLEYTFSENKSLKAEISRYRNELPQGSLSYFSNDIFKIRTETEKILKVFQDIHSGKEIDLKSILGFNEARHKDPAKQICDDIFKIKGDLNKILVICSEIYANQSEFACRTQ